MMSLTISLDSASSFIESTIPVDKESKMVFVDEEYVDADTELGLCDVIVESDEYTDDCKVDPISSE